MVAVERISLTARALGCAWLGLAWLCETENENEPRPTQVNKQAVVDQKATKDLSLVLWNWDAEKVPVPVQVQERAGAGAKTAEKTCLKIQAAANDVVEQGWRILQRRERSSEPGVRACVQRAKTG
jgi:hypothetical protein